ncbi:MAG: ankyrin repeat domain-containing protein [Cellulophaga sp.]
MIKAIKKLFKFRDESHKEENKPILKSTGLQNNKSILNQDQKPNSPELVKATKEGDLEQVINLLSEGNSPNSAHPNEKDYILPNTDVLVNMRVTALCCAAERGYHKIVEVLLNAGADPNLLDTKTSYQSSPLFYAAHRGNLECVELLINAGANMHYYEPRLKYAVLTHAAIADKIDIVIYLLKRGFDLLKIPDLDMCFSCGGVSHEVFALLNDYKAGYTNLDYLIEELEALS